MSKFANLVRKLKKEPHPPSDPAAVAASIGRKKLGAATFQRKAAAGRAKKK